MKYFVEIRKNSTKSSTDEVIKRMPAPTLKQAEKIDAGVNINLNHDEYYTMIVEGDTK